MISEISEIADTIDIESSTESESNLKSEDQTKTKNAIVPLSFMNDASEIEAKESKLEYFKSRMKANWLAE